MTSLAVLSAKHHNVKEPNIFLLNCTFVWAISTSTNFIGPSFCYDVMCLSAEDVITFTLTEVGLYVYYGSNMHASIPNVIKVFRARFGKYPTHLCSCFFTIKEGSVALWMNVLKKHCSKL